MYTFLAKLVFQISSGSKTWDNEFNFTSSINLELINFDLNKNLSNIYIAEIKMGVYDV